MERNIDLIELSERIYQKIIKEVTEASYENRIDEILKKYGLDNEIQYSYYDINNSKILVVGQSMVDKDIMIAIAKKYGIRENRFEFELDYDKLTNYDFSKLKNSVTYSDVLVGPMPHKVSGIGDYSSFLTMTDAEPENYPKIIRLASANELKITKETFRNALINTRLYNDLYN